MSKPSRRTNREQIKAQTKQCTACAAEALKIRIDAKSSILLTKVYFCNILTLYQSGHSSVGRVQASQAWCREFESRCPLQLNDRPL